MTNIERIKQEIKNIENWKGDAYQEGDEVSNALENIKDILEQIEKENN